MWTGCCSRRCRNFPGMVNNCSIDWLFPWPDQALLAVATELITPNNPMIPGQYRQPIIEHVVDVHKSVIDVSRDFVTTLRRQNYVTPRNFLDFIATYQVPTSPCSSLQTFRRLLKTHCFNQAFRSPMAHTSASDSASGRHYARVVFVVQQFGVGLVVERSLVRVPAVALVSEWAVS